MKMDTATLLLVVRDIEYTKAPVLNSLSTVEMEPEHSGKDISAWRSDRGSMVGVCREKQII